MTSKEFIKNIVHRLEVDQLEVPVKGQKTTPKVLFIEADEDHVSYQDGKNRFMKLVYIHEWYQPTTGEAKHHSLQKAITLVVISGQSTALRRSLCLPRQHV
ncbi:hypothetical protein IDE03_002997 [Enterococcus faecalis]|uniref:Uncharacterized protein n=1 Tax=Enterococcus faecalis TaxID=1351 RepID=A0A8B3RS74_ENTFL|nr:UPF0236 family protein [Enterococcus faecalis]EGO2662942.1 hypothetical protein [Enterococcus faecalis]EGO2699494.1 hypothetical protein [Enterococcus faecalis]EGO2735827.1 hypothetical protein [Enterococcus faecalis]EGO2744198.1 hypothetical protein [Enterococcus faecalis]EGO2804370.1 hypothetical protein [Enterococcus faecalis]